MKVNVMTTGILLSRGLDVWAVGVCLTCSCPGGWATAQRHALRRRAKHAGDWQLALRSVRNPRARPRGLQRRQQPTDTACNGRPLLGSNTTRLIWRACPGVAAMLRHVSFCGALASLR